MRSFFTFAFSLMILSLALCFMNSKTAGAEEVRVAVASNFHNPLKVIAGKFEKQSGHKIRAITGSTGKLYAQILHGAPFDLFLAADSKRPLLLEKNGQAKMGSRLTYAQGRLALWSVNPDAFSVDGILSLDKMNIKRLALANPKTAPYGLAARQTLEKLDLWKKLGARAVRGENIGQTFQFVLSGNVQLGFVALSQVLDPKNKSKGKYWKVPSDFHDPLNQDAVLLERGNGNPAAKDFLEFLKSELARKVIISYGYDLPE